MEKKAKQKSESKTRPEPKPKKPEPIENSSIISMKALSNYFDYSCDKITKKLCLLPTKIQTYKNLPKTYYKNLPKTYYKNPNLQKPT